MSAVEEPQANGQQDSPLADDTPELIQDKGSNDGDDDDLFGSDNDETVQKQKRALDDQELDSGDDLGRDDRVADTVEDAEEEEEAGGARLLRTIDCDVPRINYPKGDEFYLLNMPNFLGIKQEAFSPDTYEPQTLAHDGDPTRQTSAYSTAMSSMFWRRDPNDSSKMQSTARFVRWEDGSITLQLATKPTQQYKVAAQPLRQGFGKKLPPGTPYDPSKDSLTFLAAAHSTQVVDLQLVHALDASMKILPTGGEQGEAEARLKQLMAATKQEGITLARPKENAEDPELARKAAEQFEKERMRAQRKRENAEERLTMKRNNVLGRAGLGGGRGGLSVAGLEDEMGMPLSRGKKKMTKRGRNRHGEIYSDDEDETMPRGRTREDEYDRNDEFLADSEEEPEQYGGDDDLLDDEEEDDTETAGRRSVPQERPRKERERTPKRSRMDEIDEDEDAEGEPDDELLRQSPQQVRKKRRVVEDEDEDE
ncbi:hypothetical protein OHC33_008417 [Knufia fluminis]|uniref:RNA polymerase-associated protein LEO1 n=1 Tax=Knufia fluminis TaxID=191047 RepID=A0AAN8EAB7_9EURO|nr:hypothetical protein OHC33_008417 [Knufia fluminis]